MIAPTLNALLDDTAARVPDRTALVRGEDSWTYRELQARVLKAASAFHARGVRKGDCVAIVLRNSPEFVAAYFGLSRLGAVAVPINFLIQKPEELRFMLDDCAAAGVVTQREFARGLLEARKRLPKLRFLWAVDMEDAGKEIENFGTLLDEAAGGLVPSVPVSGGDTAAIIYTSGTTGSPKGVMLSHSNLVSNCEGSTDIMRLTERDVCLTILPMFHTFAWTACVLISIQKGIKNVVVASITPASAWLKLMGRHGVTIFAAVPQIYSVLAKEAQGFKRLVLRYWFFRRIRLAVSGAAPLSAQTAEAFRSAFGITISEGYGLTETSPVATINPIGRQRPGSVGIPIKGVRLKILKEDGSAAGPGEEGEICIQGPNVMLGYHNRPKDTQESFTEDGYLKSGDIGSVDSDGYLYIRDRKKDMIIIKGLKVFSAQVEQILAEHPAVEEAAIVGIPDASGDEIIKAFIVPKPGTSPEKSELLQYARRKLDAYKRPRDIEIVDSLPKNALQKVLKRVLRQKELEKRG